MKRKSSSTESGPGHRDRREVVVKGSGLTVASRCWTSRKRPHLRNQWVWVLPVLIENCSRLQIPRAKRIASEASRPQYTNHGRRMIVSAEALS